MHDDSCYFSYFRTQEIILPEVAALRLPWEDLQTTTRGTSVAIETKGFALAVKGFVLVVEDVIMAKARKAEKVVGL